MYQELAGEGGGGWKRFGLPPPGDSPVAQEPLLTGRPAQWNIIIHQTTRIHQHIQFSIYNNVGRNYEAHSLLNTVEITFYSVID